MVWAAWTCLWCSRTSQQADFLQWLFLMGWLTQRFECSQVLVDRYHMPFSFSFLLNILKRIFAKFNLLENKNIYTFKINKSKLWVKTTFSQHFSKISVFFFFFFLHDVLLFISTLKPPGKSHILCLELI